MILYMIRHAKSIGNEKELVTGTVFDNISQNGMQELEKAKVWFDEAEIKGDYYFTSQWQRAEQTGKMLWPDVVWQNDKRLGETDAGIVADWHLNDFLNKYPDFYDNNDSPYPGGESHNDLNERVLLWLNEILIEYPVNSKIIIVTHSGPISCILQKALKINMDHFPVFLPLNCSLSILDMVNNDINKSRLLGFSICSSQMLKKLG